ncbi:hypothetical protein Tdes44962_MAKER02883 [Teratosphaeria destructans]|uniref:Uncharacterized protein n=1 Tax=Teratosphaeria destructans TaxID=418781 RepID=A0A9W7W296_9PEZI|nr:hypothetical protein Tdes44962_MAKER02883 [Teratosphaeria destructans]
MKSNSSSRPAISSAKSSSSSSLPVTSSTKPSSASVKDLECFCQSQLYHSSENVKRFRQVLKRQQHQICIKLSVHACKELDFFISKAIDFQREANLDFIGEAIDFQHKATLELIGEVIDFQREASLEFIDQAIDVERNINSKQRHA